MHRDHYNFGIFFFGLYVVAALVQSIVFFQIGYQVYQLPSFANWLLALIGTRVIGYKFVLEYFHHKGYVFVFATGILSLAVELFQHLIFYLTFLLLIKDLQPVYMPAVVLSVGTGLLYAIGLVFSKAGRNLWLRASGIITLIVGGLSVYALILSFSTQAEQLNSTITQLSQWISLAGCLVVVPLIVLFYKEPKSLKAYSENSGNKKSIEGYYALGTIAVLAILVMGFKIGGQSYSVTHVSASTKAIAEPFEARAYVSPKGDTLLYRLLTPTGYNPDKQYPMVVCLHGGAGWGTDNYRQFDGSLFARLLSKPENREKYAAFLFVPQCPPGSSWGGLPGLSAIDSLVFEAISAVEQEFAIDRNRLYVAGHSLGGYGTWNFIGKHPERFAAAIPVAGEGDPALAPNMRDVAIWAFHGANDKNVPVSGSRNMIEAIQKAGGNPRYTESPNGGHSWEIVTDTPGVLDWLFAQKRE